MEDENNRNFRLGQLGLACQVSHYIATEQLDLELDAMPYPLNISILKIHGQ